eukprot:1646084-Pleurochrysis_carterae.AAC.1
MIYVPSLESAQLLITAAQASGARVHTYITAGKDRGAPNLRFSSIQAPPLLQLLLPTPQSCAHCSSPPS